MITYEQASTLIRKFKVLPKYPNDEGEARLIKALQAASEFKYAAKWVEDWINHNRKCPMPCDVFEQFQYRGGSGGLDQAQKFLKPLAPGEAVPPPDYYCNQCEDTGFFIVRTDVPMPDAPNWYYEAAKRCTHPPTMRGAKS